MELELPETAPLEQSVQLNTGTDDVQVVRLVPSHFSVDPTALDQGLCSLGRLMLYYGEIEVTLGAEVARRQARLKELEGELDLSIRASSVGSADRVTENRISSLVKTNPSHKVSTANLVESEKNHNMMKWVMHVLRGKRDILIALTYREKELIKSDRF